MSRCDEGLNFKGDKPTCKEACAKYFAGAAKKSCKADDKECFMKFKKMAGTCMEKKCSQKPSCEDACATKAKAGAKENCSATFEKGDCEQGCKDYYTEAAKKSCKKD